MSTTAVTASLSPDDTDNPAARPRSLWGTVQRSSAYHIVSGSFSALVSSALLQPLDVVKTTVIATGDSSIAEHLNAVPHHTPHPKPPFTSAATATAAAAASSSSTTTVNVAIAESAASSSCLAANSGIGKSSWHVLRTIAVTEGASGLWAGVGPTVLRIVPAAGMYFGLLHAGSSHLEQKYGRPLTGIQNLAVGGAARAAVAFCTNPLFVLKTRMEYYRHRGLYRSTLHGLVSITRQERLHGLFRGSTATILRDAPYSAFQLYFYRSFQSILSPICGEKSPTTNMTAAFCGAFFATGLTHPFDVIRTRVQLELTMQSELRTIAGASIAASLRHNQEVENRMSISGIIRNIWSEQGFVGFFRGIDARVVKRSLASMITWLLYEELIKTKGNKISV